MKRNSADNQITGTDEAETEEKETDRRSLQKASVGMAQISLMMAVVLTIYGSEDQVLSREKLEAGREIVPDSYTEFCIEGGNHAGFGDYGAQPGDGTSEITPEDQWAVTTGQILSLINGTA